MPLLARLVPETLPVSGGPGLDLRVLAFAGLITAVTGIGFGVVPALRACRGTEFDSLRDGGRSGGGRQGLRAALVITEVAASVVLLISAGLLLRALWRIQSVDPGFRADGVLTLRTALPMPKYALTGAAGRLLRPGAGRSARAARAYPRRRTSAFLPMAMGGGIWPVTVEGEPTADRGAGSHRFASLRYRHPGFFETLEVPAATGARRGIGGHEGESRTSRW